MSRLSAVLISIGITATAIIAWRGYLLIKLRQTIEPTARYWNDVKSEPVASNAITYVAMGDSAAQGIGASSHSKSYVALIAEQISSTTGRSVRIINLSKTGARMADLRRDQLPQLANLKPDVITVDIGANDVVHATPTQQYISDFEAVLAALPADRSVVSDLPSFGSVSKHQLVAGWNTQMKDLANARGFVLAPLNSITTNTERDITTYAADFFHPSDKGYFNWYKAFYPQVGVIIKNNSVAASLN